MALALTWFLWPSKGWLFDAKAFAAFVVAAITWLGSIATERKTSDHDKALLQRFRETIDSDQVTFLRRHDFGASFERRRLAGMFRIDSEWEGAEFRFDDPIVDRDFAVLVEQILTFVRYVAHNTWPIDGEREWSTAVPERNAEWSERTVARVDKLNNDSSGLSTAIDGFVMKARSRFG